ncbi:hypothetical protein BDR04DRAFT_1209360 [Suillus decipiens]|nr:hypothetical protein BDR04DRAFT_1209360 [Suillus decipiens]
MKLSLLFSVLASIVVLATAYPTQGAAGFAKRSNVEKRDSEDVDVYDNDYVFDDYKKRDEVKRDSEDVDVYDNDYKFVIYKKRDEGKRASDEADVFDNGYNTRTPELDVTFYAVPVALLNLNMKFSLLFTVLASIMVLITEYPAEGATDIAKCSNVKRLEDLDTAADDYSFIRYGGPGKRKRDSEEIDVLDKDYDFKKY